MLKNKKLHGKGGGVDVFRGEEGVDGVIERVGIFYFFEEVFDVAAF